MSHFSRRPALYVATCVSALGLGIAASVPAAASSASPASPASSASSAPSTDATTRQYEAEQVHHFLEGFYGNHGPRSWERENLVADQLKEKAAQTPDYDLLLCAQNTPQDIEIGPVTTAQSAGMGWAPVTTHWKGGDREVFTAYVGLDASKPIKLTDISCTAPNN